MLIFTSVRGAFLRSLESWLRLIGPGFRALSVRVRVYEDVVTYDTALRQLTDATTSGVTASQTWSANDLLLSSTDPAGRTTTTIYDDQDRPTHTYGPAPADCFGTDRVPTAACPLTAHTTTTYDGAMAGLAASYYENTTLAGAPKTFTLGIGGTNGALQANWGSASPTTGC